MKLSIGIIGLPNIGKTALFNALTNSTVDTQNFMFSTLEPNVGIVPVPDKRLNVLSELSESIKITPATVEFVDIAGLAKGGEGLGNRYLSNIRQTSALAQVVRCFEDDNVLHVHGEINPLSDVEIVNLELILADLEVCQKSLVNQAKKARSNKSDDIEKKELLEKLIAHLEENQPVRTLKLSENERKLIREYQFLTDKKVIYVANVSEDQLAADDEKVNALKAFAHEQGDQFMKICAKLESDLVELEEEEKKEYMAEVGIKESGLEVFIQGCFKLLGLQTYLTTGRKETRAWTIPIGATAPQAAGEIHSDFERGFIRANIISYNDFVKCGTMKEAKEKGLIRQEGKDYIMKDSDVVEFLFNV